MTKRAILFLSLALLPLTRLAAAPVDTATAKRVAYNFLSTKKGSAKETLQLQYADAGWIFRDIYLFTAPQGGFVLVSANDVATPVLAYSADGRLNPSEMPPQLAFWLRGCQEKLEALYDGDAVPSAATAKMWQQLSAEDFDAKAFCDRASKSAVGPLLTTTWNQENPYNELCPSTANGRAATGCAATAQAMFMKYWNYPPFGIGSHSYIEQTHGELSADFGNTMYDWDNMPNYLTAQSAADQRHAVAELMFHIGVSLDMFYRPAAQGGSGATGLSAPGEGTSMNNSLLQFFHYSPSMRVVNKDEYANDNVWRDTLIAELSLLHPILYTGADHMGGHAFVCDGYDDRGFLHFNFGWSGMGDGFYAAGDITPNVGGAGGNATGTFNRRNLALLGAVPNPAPLSNTAKFVFGREGGQDSLLAFFGGSQPWTATSSASWLSVQECSFDSIGHIVLVADENTSGDERHAVLTLLQDGLATEIDVVQTYYGEEEQCPVMLVMRSSGPVSWGWRGGAYVSLESPNGRVYATAALDGNTTGNCDTVFVSVDPHNLVVVWHSGGTFDQLYSYDIYNQHGETIVSVANAASDEGRHFVEWPCAHLSVSDVASDGLDCRVSPNPTHDKLHVDGYGIERLEIFSLLGDKLLTYTVDGTLSGHDLNVGALPGNVFLLRIFKNGDIIVRKIVKH